MSDTKIDLSRVMLRPDKDKHLVLMIDGEVVRCSRLGRHVVVGSVAGREVVKREGLAASVNWEVGDPWVAKTGDELLSSGLVSYEGKEYSV